MMWRGDWAGAGHRHCLLADEYHSAEPLSASVILGWPPQRRAPQPATPILQPRRAVRPGTRACWALLGRSTDWAMGTPPSRTRGGQPAGRYRVGTEARCGEDGGHGRRCHSTYAGTYARTPERKSGWHKPQGECRAPPYFQILAHFPNGSWSHCRGKVWGRPYARECERPLGRAIGKTEGRTIGKTEGRTITYILTIPRAWGRVGPENWDE